MAAIKTNKSVFPQNNAQIIIELLKKYEANEPIKEIFRKIKEGQKTNGRIVADLILQVAQNKISKQKLGVELKGQLGITKAQAVEMVKELDAQILSFAKSPPTTILVENEKDYPQRKISDPYRETTG